MGQTQGVETGLAINGDRYCFTKIEDLSTFERVDASVESLCGRLMHAKEEVTEGIVIPRLTITMMPSPQELETLLPLLLFEKLGEATSWTPRLSLASLPDFNVMVNRVASVDVYEGGVMDKWVIRGQKGTSPWTLEMQIVFASKPKISSGVTFSPDAIAGSTAPYAFSQSTYSINAKTHQTQSIVLAADYKTLPNGVQHNNSIYPTSVKPTDQLFYFGPDFPYSTVDEVALVTAFTGVNTGAASQAGYGGTMTFTSGSVSTAFAMHNLKGDIKPPSIGGREEVRNRPWYQLYGSVAGETDTPALTITNTLGGD